MYKFKKLIIFENGQKIELPIIDYFSFSSYDNAREFLEKKGFKHYMFILKKVS